MMNYPMSVPKLLAAFACASAVPAIAQPTAPPPAAIEISAGGSNALSSRLNGAVVNAYITTGFVDKPTLPACTGSRIPCSVVSNIQLFVNGAPVDVPKSVILRLADINRAWFRSADRQFELVLACGDAAEAYTAYLRFDRKRATRLDIVAGEAGLLEERTRYYDLSDAFQ